MFCQIRVKGHLASEWASWFDGLLITNEASGEAVLNGTLPDQAALFGILNRIQALNLELISVDCTPISGLSNQKRKEKKGVVR